MTSREKAELASYQLREVAKVWYTQWKDNSPVESDLIEWEEFKEDFLRKYFPCKRREVKVEEFINIKQGNMSVKEYSWKFSMFSRYARSLVSNPRDEMSHFVTGVVDLGRDECRKAMLHDDITLARLIVYAQSIERSSSNMVYSIDGQ